MLIEKNSEVRIREILKENNLTEEDIDKAVSKLYQLADILFDVWFESKKE